MMFDTCVLLSCAQVRKAEGSTEAYAIERPVRVLASPVSAQLQRRAGDRAVGVVRLSSFNARAERDLAAALRRLEAEGATEFELDLRDNRWAHAAAGTSSSLGTQTRTACIGCGCTCMKTSRSVLLGHT